MGVLESSIERDACVEIEEELAVQNIKIKVRHWPDRLFVIPGGRPFFIEFKRPNEEPEPGQLAIHRMLRRMGYEVEVHDDVTKAFEAVRGALLRARERARGVDPQAKASRSGQAPR